MWWAHKARVARAVKGPAGHGGVSHESAAPVESHSFDDAVDEGLRRRADDTWSTGGGHMEFISFTLARVRALGRGRSGAGSVGDQARCKAHHEACFPGYREAPTMLHRGCAGPRRGCRRRARGRHPPGRCHLETLARLAAGAEVPLLWLLTGLSEGEASAPAPLAQQPGWSAALQGAIAIRPDVLPWAWDWVGHTRLPGSPAVAPSPSLILDLTAGAARQFGHESVFRPAQAAYELPPISKRPRTRKAAPGPRKPVAKKTTRRG